MNNENPDSPHSPAGRPQGGGPGGPPTEDPRSLPPAPGADAIPEPPDPGTLIARLEAERLEREREEAARWNRTSRGLSIWFILLAALGVGGLLLGQTELAGLAAVAGLFVAAQAADVDARWRMLHYMLAWVLPAMGSGLFIGLGALILQRDVPGVIGMGLGGLCFGAALASFLTYFRPFSSALAWVWFKAEPSHTLRLAARMAFLGFAFVLPGWYAVHYLFDDLGMNLDQMITGTSLTTGLLGYVLLAFASVGFLLRRDLRATCERLDLGPINGRNAVAVVIGVAAMFILNAGADIMQHHWFRDLWEQDQKMSQMIAGHLGLGETLVLGLSAGIGEEITMRGALQPRFGLGWTSLFFACLHVQYSWFGMGVIFALGLLLGILKNRTNTTTVMAVHAIYDVLAVLTMPGG